MKEQLNMSEQKEKVCTCNEDKKGKSSSINKPTMNEDIMRIVVYNKGKVVLDKIVNSAIVSLEPIDSGSYSSVLYGPEEHVTKHAEIIKKEITKLFIKRLVNRLINDPDF